MRGVNNRGLSVAAAAITGWLVMAGVAAAQTVYGPVDGEIGLQASASEMGREIHRFHDLLLWIITPITLFVLALLLWVMLRYNRAANPTPKKFTHNLFIEVVWTIVPVFILVVIAAFSFPLLFKQERIPQEASLTIKATGNTWFWTYSYPDQNVEFASNPLSEDEAKAQGRPFRMAVNEPMYVPVDTTVRMQVTSNDVIHAFSVQAFGIKEDATPGRLNETWFRADTKGTFYGFCQELCGIQHSFMPIEVRVVDRAEFDRWIESKGGKVATAAAAPAAPAPPPATPETPAAAQDQPG